MRWYEMWIKSYDGTILLNTDRVSEFHITGLGEHIFEIVAELGGVNRCYLGSYKKKDQAKIVLDRILSAIDDDDKAFWLQQK